MSDYSDKIAKVRPAHDAPHAVTNPAHYLLGGVQSKDMIKLILNSDLCKHMTPYQHACLFSILKYRFRAGKKGGSLVQDIEKSIEFESMGKF